jgi:hypothetical protein
MTTYRKRLALIHSYGFPSDKVYGMPNKQVHAIYRRKHKAMWVAISKKIETR